MSAPLLHPEPTDDPRLIRWVTNTAALPAELPQLAALIDEQVLDRVEVSPDAVRTWLGDKGSWASDGPRVRSALLDALSEAATVEFSDAELHCRIEEILAREVAPVAESHGGGVRVASVCDGVLTVELTGACHGCAESERTVGQLVSRAVQARYPAIREVRAIKPRTSWLPLPRRRKP